MRDRLPFFQGQEQNDKPEEQAPSNDSATADADANDGDATGIHRLGGAFDRIAEVVTEEIESLRGSSADLDRRISRRVDTTRAETTAAIEGLRQTLLSRVEELRKEQRHALGESAAETHKRLAELRASFEHQQTQADARTEEVKAALEEILAEKEREIHTELGDLGGSLERVQVDLRLLTEASRNVTALLNGLAGVLSGHAALEGRPRPELDHPTPASAEAAGEGTLQAAEIPEGGRKDVDHDLRKIFR